MSPVSNLDVINVQTLCFHQIIMIIDLSLWKYWSTDAVKRQTRVLKKRYLQICIIIERCVNQMTLSEKKEALHDT
jgi:hypothetical protein